MQLCKDINKVCLRPYISRLCELLQPSQLGVGTPRGCEATVHATRSFIAQTQGEKVLLKLYVKNAFNSLRRDKVLQVAQTHLPEIYPFIWDYYSSKTSLFHGDFRLDSATGVQQGVLRIAILMSSVLQSPSELVPKSLKAQNSTAAKLLMSWGSMASPVLKMQASPQDIQPSTPSSGGH